MPLADLAHAGLAARRLLGPLAPQEAAQLLDGLLEDAESPGWEGRRALREQALRRAGGLPFFVVSCAQALHSDLSEGHTANAMPWDVGQSVRQRVAALPEGVREVLSTAAVMGRVVEPGILREVVAQPERDVLRALDLANRARLLVEEHHAYQFAHDVIREVVGHDVGVAQRAFLHRRVAEALEQLPGEPPVELLAYHYSRSEEQTKAVLYLERAGDRACARFAHAAAAGYYRELVALLDGLQRSAEAAAAREKLGAVLQTAAHYDEALAVLEQAAATFQAASNLESLGRTLALIGHAHGHRGTPEEGIRRIQPALVTIDTGTRGAPGSLAALHVALALLFFMSGRCAEQLAAVERAVALAHTAGDDRLLADAQWMHGLALVSVGRFEEGFRVNEEAIHLCEATNSLFSLSHVLNNAGEVYRIQGDFATAGSYYERAREVGEQLGDPAQIVHLLCNQSLLALQTGDWAKAQLEAERALTLSRQIGASWAVPVALGCQGLLCLVTGDWTAATRYLEESLRAAEPSADLQSLRYAQAGLAEIDLLEGRPQAARERLLPLLDLPGLEEFAVTQLLPLLGWIYLELGDEARAGASGAGYQTGAGPA